MRFVRGTADQRLFDLELQIEHPQHLDGFGDDLGADAVTRQDRNLHESVPLDFTMQRRSTSTFSQTLKNT